MTHTEVIMTLHITHNDRGNDIILTLSGINTKSPGGPGGPAEPTGPGSPYNIR